MAAVDVSWLPEGKHAVKIGQSLIKALKVRRGETTQSRVSRELYACHYKDMPASVDEHGPGTLELTPGEAGAPNAVTLDRGSVGTDDIQVFTGAEVAASEKQCVLVFDEDTGEITLEKVDSMFRLQLAKKNYAPLRTVASPPRQTSSSKDRSAPNTKYKSKAIIADDEEEGEISEEGPIAKTKSQPAARVPAKASVTTTSSLPKPKLAAGAKTAPSTVPKARPIVRKRTPEPKPKPKPEPKLEPIALPGGGQWKDDSGTAFDAPSAPKRQRKSPSPVASGSGARPAMPSVPNVPAVPRVPVPPMPSIPMPPAPSTAKPISTLSAAASAASEEDDWEEVGADTATQPDALPEHPPAEHPPARRVLTLVEVDADEMSPRETGFASMPYGADADTPIPGSNGAGEEEEEDILEGAFVDDGGNVPEDNVPDGEADDDDDDDMEEVEAGVGPEVPAEGEDIFGDAFDDDESDSEDSDDD